MAVIGIARDGEVAIVTLNRPEVLNAVDAALRDAFVAAMREFGAEAAVRAVVVTGAGPRAFCAGQDLAASSALTEATVADWFEGLRGFYQSVRAMEKPVVAALNGLAAGAGLQLALWCDMRIAHPEVKLSQPEIDTGLPSILGPLVMRLVMGRSRTAEMALSCRQVEAEEALSFGLLSEIVEREQVLPRAVALARTLGAKPPNAMRLTKRRICALTQAAFDEAVDAALAAQREAYRSGEPQAAARAFLERRAGRGGRP